MTARGATIAVLKPGPRTTVQSSARHGLRHLGVATGGAADPLSLALANKLLGNPWHAPALEFTLTGPTLQFEHPCSFAITNATAKLNRYRIPLLSTLRAAAGDELAVGNTTDGARGYIAFAGGLRADVVLGSASTDIQAGFGGLAGRALQSGDVLHCDGESAAELETPEQFRIAGATGIALRTTQGAEHAALNGKSRERLFSENWRVGQRADRMGVKLDGPMLTVASDGEMDSVPVFPGTVQCPESGAPFLLGADAGTLGGYPRIAQVARVDRHRLGQLRPGDRLRFMRTENDAAVAALAQKLDYWRDWLPDIDEIIA